MALEFERQEGAMAKWKTDRRLYLTQEGQVTDDEQRGKWLLAPAGRDLDEATCRRYGLGPYDGKPEPETPVEEETRGIGVKTPRRSSSRRTRART